MRNAIPDWEVPASAWGPLVNAFTLPETRHVLAAAVAGHADCIVTSNLRHFPDDAVRSYGVEVGDPDRFVVNQWDLDPLVAIAAFKHMRARWKRPQATPEDFAQALEGLGGPWSAAACA